VRAADDKVVEKRGEEQYTQTFGNERVALYTPPSKGVPSGPWMKHSHSKKSSSDTGPAQIPSGQSLTSCLYSCKSRRVAVAAMIYWTGSPFRARMNQRQRWKR